MLHRHFVTVLSYFFAGCLFVAASGCGSDDGRMKVHPVGGSISVKGQPAEGATIVLFAVDEALRGPGKPIPTGVAGPDGKFQLTSYEPNDGAPVGEYQATIVWPEPVSSSPNSPEIPTAKDRLKDRYAAPANSGLTATIEAGTTELPPFDLQ